MKIPKYWRKYTETVTEGARTLTISSWGHSDVSADDALAHARERWPTLRQAIHDRSSQRSYEYYADALREHRQQSWKLDDREYAVITRNGYGALVLNTTSVMFADIDVKPGVRFLFWGKSTQQKKKEAAARTASILLEHNLSGRIYETASGLRLLVTDRLFQPSDDASMSLMQQLQVDTIYLRLCQTQQCFRARLSPKPWRLNLPRPPQRFPEDPSNHVYADWVASYEQIAKGKPVCRLMQETGSPTHPEIRAVTEIHDEYCNIKAPGELV